MNKPATKFNIGDRVAAIVDNKIAIAHVKSITIVMTISGSGNDYISATYTLDNGAVLSEDRIAPAPEDRIAPAPEDKQ